MGGGQQRVDARVGHGAVAALALHLDGKDIRRRGADAAVRSNVSGDTRQPQRDVLRSGHSQTISKSSRAAAYTNARCTFRAATTVRDPFPQVSARYSIARMHWLDPSVEYTVRPEPNSFPA